MFNSSSDRDDSRFDKTLCHLRIKYLYLSFECLRKVTSAASVSVCVLIAQSYEVT